MRSFNFLDTKFLAINGDLSSTISGGTAMLHDEVCRENKKVIIRAKIPTIENRYLSLEIVQNQLIISASVQSISNTGIVFNLPFASKSFKIPEGVNVKNIEAYEFDGHLIVEMPITNTRSRHNNHNIDINFDDEF
jgi:HSP20 family molecular chaperone IbpA